MFGALAEPQQVRGSSTDVMSKLEILKAGVSIVLKELGRKHRSYPDMFIPPPLRSFLVPGLCYAAPHSCVSRSSLGCTQNGRPGEGWAKGGSMLASEHRMKEK